MADLAAHKYCREWRERWLLLLLKLLSTGFLV